MPQKCAQLYYRKNGESQRCGSLAKPPESSAKSAGLRVASVCKTLANMVDAQTGANAPEGLPPALRRHVATHAA